jgi:hypothetical protein
MMKLYDWVEEDWLTGGNKAMVNKLFMDLRKIFAELAATLILGKYKDAAAIANCLSEKSKALAEELGKQGC